MLTDEQVAAILDFAADPIGATRKRIIAAAEVASRTSMTLAVGPTALLAALRPPNGEAGIAISTS
jgi:hypothetical protein